MSNRLVLSKALLDLSQETGWTQAQIGEKLDVSRITIHRWTTGESIPHPYHWRKLEALLELPQETLQAPLPDTQRTPASLAVFDPSIPPPPSVLFGRENAIETIRESLCTPTTTGAPSVAVLCGLPGVGKTALATALAYDEAIQRRFPAGVLWAGLGQHPDYFRLLSHWGQVLGISSKVMETQTSLDEWARLLRLAIKDRSFLIVLDDAWSTEDALALQVGGSNCAYLITTRFPAMAATLAVEGGIYQVPELKNADGLYLLQHFAPAINVTQQAHVAQKLVHAVGGLPLALILMAHYLQRQSYSQQPRRITAALERLLSDIHTRLSLSKSLEPTETSVGNTSDFSLRSIIALSTDQLSESTRQALYALSILPAKPDTFSEEMACAVAACLFKHLDTLTDAGLLELNTADRYSLHQTIADYAQTHLLPEDKDAAMQRLVFTVRSYVEQHTTDYERLARESSVILAALDVAVVAPEYPALLALVSHAMNFMISQAWYDQCERYLQVLAHAAEERNDPEGRVIALLYQGILARKRKNLSAAEEILRAGVSLAKEHQLSEVLIELYIALCGVLVRIGQIEQTLEYAQEGITLAESTGSQVQVCHLLHVFCQGLYQAGNDVETKAMLQKGLALARATNHKELMCKFFVDGAGMLIYIGSIAESLEWSEEGLEVARSIGHREYQCALLINRAWAYQSTEDNPQILQKMDECLQEAETIAQQLNHIEYLSPIWNLLASQALLHGNVEEAITSMSQAVALSQTIGNTISQIQSYNFLIEILLSGDQVERALPYIQQMLELTSSTALKLRYQGHLLFYLGTASYQRWNEQDEQVAALAHTKYLEAAAIWQESGFAYIDIAWCALSSLAADQNQWLEAHQYFAKITSTPEKMIEDLNANEPDLYWYARYQYLRSRLALHQGASELARKLAREAEERLQRRGSALYGRSRTMLHTIQQWLASLSPDQS